MNDLKNENQNSIPEENEDQGMILTKEYMEQHTKKAFEFSFEKDKDGMPSLRFEIINEKKFWHHAIPIMTTVFSVIFSIIGCVFAYRWFYSGLSDEQKWWLDRYGYDMSTTVNVFGEQVNDPVEAFEQGRDSYAVREEYRKYLESKNNSDGTLNALNEEQVRLDEARNQKKFNKSENTKKEGTIQTEKQNDFDIEVLQYLDDKYNLNVGYNAPIPTDTNYEFIMKHVTEDSAVVDARDNSISGFSEITEINVTKISEPENVDQEFKFKDDFYWQCHRSELKDIYHDYKKNANSDYFRFYIDYDMNRDSYGPDCIFAGDDILNWDWQTTQNMFLVGSVEEVYKFWIRDYLRYKTKEFGRVFIPLNYSENIGSLSFNVDGSLTEQSRQLMRDDLNRLSEQLGISDDMVNILKTGYYDLGLYELLIQRSEFYIEDNVLIDQFIDQIVYAYQHYECPNDKYHWYEDKWCGGDDLKPLKPISYDN